MEMVNFVGNCIQRKNVEWLDLESFEGVVDNVLSSLPVKCLLNVKAVSKFLRDLIRSQAFIRLHLSRSRENALYIFFPFMPINRNIYIIDADAVVTETVTLPTDENLSTLSMVCSYNGLICLTNFPVTLYSYSSQGVAVADLEILICNPATHEVGLLPKCSPSEEDLGIGVAFGPEISEYKVFRFFRSKSNSEIVLPDPEVVPYWFLLPTSRPETVLPPECEIYSSRTGTWSCIGPVQHRPMGAHHVFVNGKVYWFIPSEENYDIPGSILSVDMEEHFEVVGLPDTLTELSFLIDFEGCLSVVAVFDKDEPVVIWILKNENEYVWEKKCSAGIPYKGMMEELHSVAARESDIFFITAHDYIILDTDDSSWELVEFEEFEPNAHAVFPYTESLLPCSGRFAGEVNNQRAA
ncbi:putative F-box protein At1g19160 [Rosa rugosa]|uniref:putative F-box protein At1g19160 n=1 Tax=Rosa rugosa TaxID=74645 RepID=UPI002B415DB3|nr:putative F-box protein At1g19160 [Rosa rugosa]XP_062018469.1 putative F-box protein At1g19160 [Rosa rugosa]XP_062018470.1 putative F-box protein At1g19160 [Rosa rugosa]